MAGYSGTPLAKKLGINEGHVVGVVNEPHGFADLLEPLPPGVQLVNGVRSRRDVVVMFARQRREIESKLAALTKAIFPDGAIWIAWPKKSAAKQLGIATDITEDTVREVALPTGLVDNKVCAIDEIWSGLRLVVRRENRR
jgi:nucleoside-diphosphate-sugar epimerase